MKSRFGAQWELFFLFVFGIPVLVIGFSSGPPAGHTGAPFAPDSGKTCTECHIGLENSNGGSVTISAPASYASGAVIPITVTVSDPAQRRWGFELSARTEGGQQAGTLTNSSSSTQIVSQSGIQYIEHNDAPTTGAGAGFTFSFTWTAPDTATGPVTFYAAGNAANANFTTSGDHIYTTNRTIQPEAVSQTPSVFENGAVNNASFAPGDNPIPAGAIAAIFGTDLNDGSENPNSSFDSDGKLLTTLGGASVTFNGVPAPMFSSFPGQLNVQVPVEVAGSASAEVEVTVSGQTSTAQTVPIGPSLPGIFTIPPGGSGQGAVQIANTVIFAATSIPGQQARPANPGEFITIYCTGLGAVSDPPGSPGTGRPGSGEPTVEMPQVTIGGIPANVTFSGLAPGFVGLYQVNAQIPEGASTGAAVPLVITLGGVQSNTVTIAIGDGQPSSANPAPTIASLSPSSFDLDLDSLNVAILGTGFTQSSTVTVNGVGRTPTYVNDTHLTILVTADDFPAEGDYPLVVTNPAPGGGSSSPYTFRARRPLSGGSDDYY